MRRHSPGALPALLACVMVSACGAPAPPQESLSAVLVQTVSYAPAQAAAVYPGEIHARHESELAFRIGGKIVAREVDAGAAVRKGQVLARLDANDVGLAAQAAQAQLAAAETDFAFAEAELARSRSLLEQRFISQTAFDAKQNAYRVARARLEQARAQRAVAANQAGYATLAADRDGVVTAINAEPGQVVAAGQVVARLAQPDEKEVWITVPEHRLAELREASRLSATLWAAPQRRYAARVREIAPAADAVTRSFQVKLGLADADGAVRLGMSANVMIAGAHEKPVALLPAAALGSSAGMPVAWVVGEQGAVQARPVEVLRYDKDGVIVGAGLKDGERVVIAGVHKLSAGQKVVPQPAPRAVAPPR